MTEQYLRKHDRALRPAGSPYAPVLTETDKRDKDGALQSIVARCYAMAKGQQDIDAALSLCHPDFVLETIPFRIVSKDREDTRQQLTLFFSAFPDFQPQADGFLAKDGRGACWGKARMSHKGDLFGFSASGKTALLPFFSAFEFRDGLLSKEIFSIDLAMLSDALELPLEPLLSIVRNLSTASTLGATNV